MAGRTTNGVHDLNRADKQQEEQQEQQRQVAENLCKELSRLRPMHYCEEHKDQYPSKKNETKFWAVFHPYNHKLQRHPIHIEYVSRRKYACGCSAVELVSPPTWEAAINLLEKQILQEII